MSLPVAVVIIVSIVLIAGALALAAFVWAVRAKQFSIKLLNEGAKSIFDDEEPVGTPQDLIFKKSSNGSPNHQ
jgi:cbb3-type cytochrome oxidase maturation protein